MIRPTKSYFGCHKIWICGMFWPDEIKNWSWAINWSGKDWTSSDQIHTTRNTGFAKTFCPSSVILSDDPGAPRQTFSRFVRHVWRDWRISRSLEILSFQNPYWYTFVSMSTVEQEMVTHNFTYCKRRVKGPWKLNFSGGVRDDISVTFSLKSYGRGCLF